MAAADLEFYQAFLSTFGLAALCATVAWWRARKRAARAEVEVAALRAASEHPGLRQAVEAIAIEVERIGEGQRFLTRMLREPGAGPVAPPRSHGRVDTPR
jgi:hypothetical protein